MEQNLNLPPFYQGQKVVALRTVKNGFGIGIIKDKEYIAHDCKRCATCAMWYVDLRLQTNVKSSTAICGICKNILKNINGPWVEHTLLAPLNEAKMKAVSFEKVMEETGEICVN